MRTLILLGLLSTLLAASGALQIRHVSLRVDHFNPLDRRMFDARYFVNSEFYQPGGPIFIYVSGGFEVYDQYLAEGNVYEIARDTAGHLFSLEHRYFGESRPVPDTSTENLQFLSPQQVVADLAHFISFIKSNYYATQNSPVVLWGRGLGGSYAVWARQKYPHLVNGAFGSSAHLQATLEYPQFMSNTFYTLNTVGGANCGNVVRGALTMIEDAIRRRNTTDVEQRLRLCGPIDVNDEADVSRLFYGISSEIGLSFVSNARYTEIIDTCETMTDPEPEDLPENDLDAFARWFVDDYNRNLQCLEYRNEPTVRRYQNIEWGSVSTIAGRRQLFWLQCTHLGQFPTANNGDDHGFGWRFDVAFFRQWCADVFGDELFTPEFIDDSIAATNTYFGGLFQSVYRLFLTYGELDPRRNLGPSEDLNANSQVVVMSLQSFGRDLGSPNSTDYAVLQQTKQRTRDTIISWILEDVIEPTEEPEITEEPTIEPAF